MRPVTHRPHRVLRVAGASDDSGRTGALRRRHRRRVAMGDQAIDELGPVDYLVVEFPAGQQHFDGWFIKD
jgi:hypothetical protein